MDGGDCAFGRAVLFGACRPDESPGNKTSLQYPAYLLCYPSLLESAPTGLSAMGRCFARINDTPPQGMYSTYAVATDRRHGHAAFCVVLGLSLCSVSLLFFRPFVFLQSLSRKLYDSNESQRSRVTVSLQSGLRGGRSGFEFQQVQRIFLCYRTSRSVPVAARPLVC